MNPEAVTLLNLRNHPALVYSEQAAAILNVPPHAMPILAAANVLQPLNHYSRTAPKVYMTEEVLQLRKDRRALIRLVRALFEHWQGKNRKRGTNPGDASAAA